MVLFTRNRHTEKEKLWYLPINDVKLHLEPDTECKVMTVVVQFTYNSLQD